MEGDRSSPSTETPLVLVTGFLGSGKTTLINRLLRLSNLGHETPRLGVVVNEFGQIGIDGTLLAEAASAGGILELSNGCVCCVRGTEMWDAALSLVDRAGAEVLLVETSGMVEPGVLLEQYRLLPAAQKSRIDLRGLLCVVDVLHVHSAVSKRPEAAQQLKLADRLLLTKFDLAHATQIANAHRLLDELGASSERASLSLGEKDPAVRDVFRWVLSPRPPSSEEKEKRTHQRGHRPLGAKQLVAVSFEEPEPLLAGPLLQLLRELRGKVLRAKGIVRVLGAPFPKREPNAPLALPGFLAHDHPNPTEAPVLAVLHLAGEEVELQPLTGPAAAAAAPNSVLVFIGEDLDENWLRLRLTACRSRPLVPSPAVHGAPPALTPRKEYSDEPDERIP